MSYREKLEKYKKNQLPEEEKKKVEDEIEKAEAINEYLADELEEELKVVARDLLPPEIIEGSMLHYEWMQYTLI